MHLGSGQRDTPLTLILTAPICIAGLTDLVGFKEQHLCNTLVGVDLRRQGRGVGKLQRNVALPLGLEWGHIYDDAAPRIGRFAQADGQHITRDAEVLHRTGEREGVGRNYADLPLYVDKTVLVEMLGVDRC